ncbi:hypothetical protein EUX98_g1751 [Antrodiella citrinella]|uniref:Uncharacterized protein n=1 Tax=Antrodiella citrinella TaxID=2447956 RepID=A0A4V3XJC3_9APHY|nr:hypothetical protein EUX98_g1751 [Antrodiella citrinella]
MEKSANIIAAFDAGKIPSQQQINSFIDWLLNSALTQVEPSDDSGELSEQGKILVGDVRNLLNAYKLAGEHKNGDNLIQEALWHLSEADISSTHVNSGADIDSDQASKDARAVAHALRTLLKIVWTNFASESESVFHDFASFSRLALADAADLVSRGAGSAAQSLREVDSEIQQGDRNELGMNKNTGEEEPKDTRQKFESAMDTVKVAGSKTIGAGQVASQTAEDIATRTSERLQNAFYTICDRAQDNEDYSRSVSTIFDILGKWIHKSLDTAGDVNTDTSLEAFIDDPTEEQHLIKAIRAVRTFVERMAGGKSLDDFFGVLRVCGVDIQQDQHLREFFDELLDHLRKSVDERGYVRSDEAQQMRDDLKAKWRELHDADTEEGQKWRDDIGKLQAAWEDFMKAFDSGEDTRRIQRAQSKLGTDLEQAMVSAAGAAASNAIDQGLQNGPWLWQDLFNAYIPRLLSIVKDIPIPRTEYSDDDVEFVLEDLDISSFNLLPGHAYIRNITDIDITAPSAGKSTTSVGSLTRVYIQALQLSLREVSFYYKDKTASVGPGEFTGLLEFTLPPQGIDVDVVVRMIPNSPEGLKERERRGTFQEIQRVDVKVSDDVDLTVKQSNHSILATVFKPLILSRFRETLQTVLADNIRASIEWTDAFAWDVGNRAEVFADAGLGRGPSLMAGFWSELGHLRKGDTGVLKGWKATGTGLIKEEGNTKAGAKFAMGAEPQILSGEKRGPKGTFSEPLAEKAQRQADEMDIDVEGTAEGARQKAQSVTAQATETLKEGVKKVRSFKQTVAEKAEEEKKRSGWKSDAFDV